MIQNMFALAHRVVKMQSILRNFELFETLSKGQKQFPDVFRKKGVP